MIWIKIGNKWFDSLISKVMDLHSSLNSCAADNSPLTSLELQELEKCFARFNRINAKISKRLNKKGELK